MIKGIQVKAKFNTIDIIKEIIREQVNIVGTKIAHERVLATKVLEYKNNHLVVLGNEQLALEKLIKSFEEVFGDASVETCLDVIKKYNTIQK